MLPFKKYLLFWPVLAAGALFLLLGMVLFLISETAMERAPKDADWVRRYRKPGFSCRRALLPAGKASLPALILLPIFAVAFRLAIRLNTIYYMTRRFAVPELSTYYIVLILLSAIGAVAVYFSLNLLYDSPFAAFWGAMLFAGSPLMSHGVVSLLACVFLLILLYLRADRPGFPTELLYLSAALLFGLVISVCPPAVWLGPVLVIVHLYKLIWQVRQGKLTVFGTVLALCVAAVCWLIFAVVSTAARFFVLSGFSTALLRQLIKPIWFRFACKQMLFDTRRFLFTMPRPGLLVNPLVDAPLFGLGLWGVVSAACMIGKRRSVRGWIALIAFAAVSLTWLLSARYLLPLGLAITVGAMLKNADLGGKKLSAALIVGTGLIYDCAILAATWALPLYIDLVCRILRFN